MKRWIGICLFAAALCAVNCAVAAESDTMAQLDEALKTVGTFEYGKDSEPLVLIEGIVVEAATDAKQREAVEQQLVKALGSASTRDARSFLCRQLRTIGTAQCVPELEKLLTDPESSHMARYALGSIEDPAASAALHRALFKTSGKVQVGIINTLANRRYSQALPDIAMLLGSFDSRVAEAAVRALGRIGGTQALKLLGAARSRVREKLHQHIDSALLVCAEQLIAEGQPAEAARVYKLCYSPSQSIHFRLAGLRGLVTVEGTKAVPLLVDAIKGEDADIRRGAIGFTSMVKDPNATKAFAGLLPSLPPDTQALMLHALGDRGDSAAAEAVADATKSSHEEVRIAAIEALGGVGDASAVSVLAQAAASAQGREKLVARASIKHLRADGVDAAIMSSVSSGDAKVRVELIHALAERKVTQAIGELEKAAADDDETVRREAIHSLGVLAGEPELKLLVELAVKPKDANDRFVIEQAVGSIFNRIEDKDRQAKPVLAALADAPSDAKPTLLRLLGKSATSKALDAVRAALKEDSNAEVKDAALRTLSEWPNTSPADDLLALASTSSNKTHKVLALRGYIRMAGMSKEPVAMYTRAMKLAERADEKKLVLGGLGSAGSAEALALAEKYLTDKQLQTEAASAVVQIADQLRKNNATRAMAALKNVLDVVENSRIRKKAQGIIEKMEQ